MRVYRVVVADDDDVLRSALVDVLDADERFEVVGVAETGEGLPALVAATGADVVLLDVRMPGGGAEAARALTSTDGSRPIVVALTAQVDTVRVLEMLRAGATGFLAKGRIGVSLPDLVARCAEGEVLLAVPTGVSALRHLVAEVTQDG
jgi:two-component system nitrate/nitrite response regulator NarL